MNGTHGAIGENSRFWGYVNIPPLSNTLWLLRRFTIFTLCKKVQIEKDLNLDSDCRDRSTL